MGKQRLPKTIVALPDKEDAEGVYGYLPKRVLWDVLHEVLALRFDTSHPEGERFITDAIVKMALKYK